MAAWCSRDASRASSQHLHEQNDNAEPSSPVSGRIGLSYDRFSPAASPVSLRSDPVGSRVGHSRHQSLADSITPLTRPESSYNGRQRAHLEHQPFSDSIVSPKKSRFIRDADTPYHSEGESRSMLSDILQSYEPPLSRLASDPSLRRNRQQLQQWRLLTPISAQRHPGKEGVRISRYTRPYEPAIEEEKTSQPNNSTGLDSAVSSEDDEKHAEGVELLFLILGLCLVVFLISIDRTIITTAIPFITAEFRSTPDIGWYGSAYLLTACAFQPIFGRVYMMFNIKWSYMMSMFMFLLGSLICGVSPNSVALIIGRAISGFGSAGLLTGSFVIVTIAVPLRLRPIYTAVVGLMFGVGATVGPLIGGVFTDLATWRWCFWLNLPAGGVTAIILLFVFHPPPHQHSQRTIKSRINDLDVAGNALLLGAAVMLFLALEFTTAGESWGSSRVIGLLCGCGIVTIALVAWQWWRQDSALLPPSIVTQRTVAASCAMAFFTYGAMLIHAYFLPIYFQAVFGVSAIQSGVDMIPYIVANALFSLLSGIFVSKIGYFAPPAIIGSAIGTIGCGVISLLNTQTTTGMWVGYQILASAGFGMSIQQGFTAVQTVLSKDEIAVGTAAVVASQSLGGAIFISVGNSIFQSRLRAVASGNGALPGVDIQDVINAGATAFRNLVTADQLPILLEQYSLALQAAFLVAVPLGGLAWLSCCCMEWKSVKGAAGSKGTDEKDSLS